MLWGLICVLVVVVTGSCEAAAAAAGSSARGDVSSNQRAAGRPPAPGHPAHSTKHLYKAQAQVHRQALRPSQPPLPPPQPMSFIKKLWKGGGRRGSDSGVQCNCDGPTNSHKGPKRRSSSSVTGRNGLGSSGDSPRHKASPGASPAHKGTQHIHTTTVGVKTPTNRHVAQVLPGLLLGSQEFSQDFSGLQRYKVTHILNITTEVDCSYPDKFIYKRIAIPDLPSIRIVQLFDEAFEFITQCRCQGGCVLVHCYYGNSRSASFVMAYLMNTEHMRYREALEYLQIIRPDVRPNDGFERQLKAYELETLCR